MAAGWEAVIGLETHLQLRTKSKMFCGCSTAFGAPPNTQVCPVCLGLPGALPVPNGAAIRLAVRGALALGCTVHPKSIFARKNYFYPDLPKGYQISQHDQPLATNGTLSFVSPERGIVNATIVRLHVEEDAGKSIHDRFPKATAVDLNRSGVPLIEIVGGPDLRSPAEARAYLQTLKQLLEYIGISDCDMEKGSLRVDANVGGSVTQQPMLYDSRENTVRPQRSKEESHDYRYFPEPDLPPLVLTPEFVAEEQSELPELPPAKRDRFAAQYALSREHATVLTASRGVAEYYENVVRAGAEHQAAANWIMTEALADAKDHQDQLRVPAAGLAQIIALVKGGTLSHQAAKRVFAEVAAKGGDPRTIAESLGLIQVADSNVVAAWVTDVLGAHAPEVGRYKNGETKLMAFFLGQVMRASKGKADPKLAQRVLEEKLASAS
ncbi:MAG: hypothetical protein AUI08_05335 [Gemmatimonadetes bacterium 13_2_20CM_2_65_7]|nr:MAG: hypothetical protein AUI08_05335 [Gemmatimonadetes bacterium 13_2_20CM_2_65_7]